MPWKHGNTLLSEISSFYAYALFRKFGTPLDSEPGTSLYILTNSDFFIEFNADSERFRTLTLVLPILSRYTDVST